MWNDKELVEQVNSCFIGSRKEKIKREIFDENYNKVRIYLEDSFPDSNLTIRGTAEEKEIFKRRQKLYSFFMNKYDNKL